MKAALTDGMVRVYADYSQKDKIKSLIGGTWNPRKKSWDFAPESLPELKDAFPSLALDEEACKRLAQENWKAQNRDRLLLGRRSPRTHAFLYQHQRLVRDLAMIYDRFGFFADTGTGKTNMGLQIITDNLPMKTLVLTPKPIIKTGWMEDQEQFFPEIKLLPLSRNMLKDHYLSLAQNWGVQYNEKMKKDDLFMLLVHNADAYVTNYEAFKADYDFIQKLGIQALILDESACLRNGPRKNKTVKYVLDMSKEMKKVYLMSGKPAPRSEEDYFYQALLITPSLLGASVTRFRNQFFYQSGFGGYTWTPHHWAPDMIGKRLRERCLFIDKNDCLDLPDKTYEIRDVELSPAVMKDYKTMEKLYMMKIEDEDAIMTPGKVQAIMKLRQITGGFIINEEGEPKHLHNEKLNVLKDTLEELGDHRAIIWVQFKHEVKAILEMLEKTQPGVPVSTAFSGTKDIDTSIADFKHGRSKYMIAHPQSLMYGATFVKDCTYAIYYSLSYDYEEYYQSHDRIYRNGQTKKCTFIFLVAPGTIDQVIRNVVLDTKKARSVKIEDIMSYRRGAGV